VVAIGVLPDSQNSDAFRDGLVPLLKIAPLRQQRPAIARLFSTHSSTSCKKDASSESLLAESSIIDLKSLFSEV
jgi:hypothetical protein